ncbi:VHS domain-containing protein [Entamoeba marina]
MKTVTLQQVMIESIKNTPSKSHLDALYKIICINPSSIILIQKALVTEFKKCNDHTIVNALKITDYLIRNSSSFRRHANQDVFSQYVLDCVESTNDFVRIEVLKHLQIWGPLFQVEMDAYMNVYDRLVFDGVIFPQPRPEDYVCVQTHHSIKSLNELIPKIKVLIKEIEYACSDEKCILNDFSVLHLKLKKYQENLQSFLTEYNTYESKEKEEILRIQTILTTLGRAQEKLHLYENKFCYYSLPSSRSPLVTENKKEVFNLQQTELLTLDKQNKFSPLQYVSTYFGCEDVNQTNSEKTYLLQGSLLR